MMVWLDDKNMEVHPKDCGENAKGKNRLVSHSTLGRDLLLPQLSLSTNPSITHSTLNLERSTGCEKAETGTNTALVYQFSHLLSSAQDLRIPHLNMSRLGLVSHTGLQLYFNHEGRLLSPCPTGLVQDSRSGMGGGPARSLQPEELGLLGLTKPGTEGRMKELSKDLLRASHSPWPCCSRLSAHPLIPGYPWGWGSAPLLQLLLSGEKDSPQMQFIPFQSKTRPPGEQPTAFLLYCRPLAVCNARMTSSPEHDAY
ncbi:hypothetical protein EK904_003248 [Melospiza melodia maxima]|nr:hypothetical protein EK904_003248 [Melospiza melodia maxima]